MDANVITLIAALGGAALGVGGTIANQTMQIRSHRREARWQEVRSAVTRVVAAAQTLIETQFGRSFSEAESGQINLDVLKEIGLGDHHLAGRELLVAVTEVQLLDKDLGNFASDVMRAVLRIRADNDEGRAPDEALRAYVDDTQTLLAEARRRQPR